MSTLLERSGGKNGKFCQQTKRRRREAYRARRQLICTEWHFLKKDKRQEECNWHSASTKQLETDCGAHDKPWILQKQESSLRCDLDRQRERCVGGLKIVWCQEQDSGYSSSLCCSSLWLLFASILGEQGIPNSSDYK